jgi:anti-sigma factor RsiW
MSGAVNETDLHAYIDGALDAVRAREIETQIAADPALARRVAQFRADKDMLKRVYAPLAERPLPDKWLEMALASKPPPQGKIAWRMVGTIAATIVLFAAVTFAYWQSRPSQPSEIVQAALDARVHDDGKFIAVSADANAQQYAAMLSTTIASHVKVPDLERMGYRLASIRLYSQASGDGSAELSYRDRENRLFTLYLRRAHGVARFDQFERDGLRVCVWQDEELSTVMAGNVSTAAMQRLASLAYTGLTI